MIFLQVQEVVPNADQIVATSSKWIDKIKNMGIEYAPKVAAAILIYIIGAWIISRISKISRKIFARKNFDVSLQKFLISLIIASLNILMFLTIAGVLGVNITGFAAILAGAGLAIGAALNGSLGNLAGGVMLMIFKPFNVGDMIEAQGSLGTVLEIGIFNTKILTPDNKTVILPNGGLSTGAITNYTTHGNLRVDLTIGIALTNDIDQARKIAVAAMLSHPKVLQDPAPEVSVLQVEVGLVTLAIRPYTTQPDYWDVYFGVQELVKNAFDANGIEAPTPTRIVINK